MNRLPTLEQMENSSQVKYDFIIDHQKVTKELKPLVKFIDFNQIKGRILIDIIEPLEIIPSKIITDAYRQKVKLHNTDLNGIRGIQVHKFNESDYVWDKSACGSKLIIEDNGKVVHAPGGCGHQSVRAKMTLDNKGIFEWDVIIEKTCTYAWVGVCAPENFNYETCEG